MDLFKDARYACCTHCIQDVLGCDPKDPGHSMPCDVPNCTGAKTR